MFVFGAAFPLDKCFPFFDASVPTFVLESSDYLPLLPQQLVQFPIQTSRGLVKSVWVTYRNMNSQSVEGPQQTLRTCNRPTNKSETLSFSWNTLTSQRTPNQTTFWYPFCPQVKVACQEEPQKEKLLSRASCSTTLPGGQWGALQHNCTSASSGCLTYMPTALRHCVKTYGNENWQCFHKTEAGHKTGASHKIWESIFKSR